MNALIYDIEIVKAVPDKKSPRLEGVEYCAGWEDHANMGISVIGAFDYKEDRYRVFCDDNFREFKELCEKRTPLVSFNGLGFDDKVLTKCGVIDLTKEAKKLRNDHGVYGGASYDILVELWSAAGLARTFNYPTHIGFGLDATAKANFGGAKTGNGALAPVEWQRGNVGAVIDYCLQDVRLTKRLFDRIRVNGGLRDPRNPSYFLEMEKPQT